MNLIRKNYLNTKNSRNFENCIVEITKIEETVERYEYIIGEITKIV